MDLHHTSSHAPVRDAELPSAGAFERPAAFGEPPPVGKARYAHPDAEVRRAQFRRKEAELEALEAEITEVWGHINAATAHFLALVAEFDRREGWAQEGVTSCAHWLNWQCGIGRVAAREKVRVARALASLPKVAQAFGAGRLSYSKVRALTRVATGATEDTLLHIALNGTAAHLERTVRGFRRVQRYLERDEAEALHRRRHLDCRRNGDGSVRLEARLSPEVGEMLMKALEAADAHIEERDGDAASEGVSAETPRRSVSQRRADALEHILGRFLAGKCSGATARAHEVVVHIAHDALRDVAESTGASFEHGRPVAVETARRLGCDRSRYVHAHHIRHWADGGETNLENLVTLCSQHHRLVHEGSYGVCVNAGEIEFTRPDGRLIPPAGTAHTGCFRGNTCANSGARRLLAFNTARGLAIDAGTARCRWGGERMDYDIAIDGLCRKAGYG